MDRRGSISAAHLFGVIGVLVFIVQPGFFQGLVDAGAITGAQAGYVAASEMAGYWITITTFSILSHRVPWRPMLALFILLQGCGNAACLVQGSVNWLCAMRFVAGLGAGGIISISFTAIGMSRTPDRYFGFVSMWQLTYGAVGLLMLPWLIRVSGFASFYVIVTVVTFASLSLVRLMPAHAGPAADIESSGGRLSILARSTALFSLMLFIVASGLFWVYVSIIGTSQGLNEQAVASSLSLSQFAGIAGSFAAGVIGARFGRLLPICLALATCAVITIALAGITAERVMLFAVIVCLFNFSWNLAQPVYLGAAAAFDSTGRLIPQMIAGQASGFAIGPLIGALMGGERHVVALISVMVTGFLLALVLILVPFREAGTRALPGLKTSTA